MSVQFDFTLGKLVRTALQQTGRFSLSDTPSSTDIANALTAFNLIVKAMVRNQTPLWCIQRYPLPLVAGQSMYPVSSITGFTATSRPMKCLYAFVRYLPVASDPTSAQDTQLTLVSREDWNRLGQKFSPGIPNQVYYDNQLAPTITIYNVPVDNQRTIYLDFQRQMADMGLVGTTYDNIDFPPEAFHMLKWKLAEELCLDYLVPANIHGRIAQKAEAAYEDFFAGERENVSIFFTPTERRY